MIKVGQMVEVISIKYTSLHCGRKSQYDIGDKFIVTDVSYDKTKGHILKDNDYNFIHEYDVKVVSKDETYMYDLLARCNDVDKTNIHSIEFLMQRLGLDQHPNKCKLDEIEWNKAILLEDKLYQEYLKGNDVLLVTHRYYPYQREIKTIEPVHFLSELTFKDFSNQYVCLDQCTHFDDEVFQKIKKLTKWYNHPFNYDTRNKGLADINYLVKQYSDSCGLYKSPIAHYYHADRRQYLIDLIQMIEINSQKVRDGDSKRVIAYILNKLKNKQL